MVELVVKTSLDMEEAIPHIEKALGFELYDHQKRWLTGKGSLDMHQRANGKTTAYCINLALTDGSPLDLRKIEQLSDRRHHEGNATYSKLYFKPEFMKIHTALKEYGFKVREVKGV